MGCFQNQKSAHFGGPQGVLYPTKRSGLRAQPQAKVDTTRILLLVSSKALRKTKISELFVFASFGNVRFSKFGNFLEKSVFFELAKILRKSLEIKVRK